MAAFAVLALLAPAAAGAKKKAKTPVFSKSVTVNQPVPDYDGTPPSTALTSTITVPKKHKGKVVGDVNVTGLQTTGSAAASASQLWIFLGAPSGRTVLLSRGMGGQSLGPWTLDDDSPVAICNLAAPPCTFASQTLPRPFAGTSNLTANDGPTLTPLESLNGTSMRGTWTLTVVDLIAGSTSTLNTWGLRVAPGVPVK